MYNEITLSKSRKSKNSEDDVGLIGLAAETLTALEKMYKQKERPASVDRHLNKRSTLADIPLMQESRRETLELHSLMERQSSFDLSSNIITEDMAEKIRLVLLHKKDKLLQIGSC